MVAEGEAPIPSHGGKDAGSVLQVEPTRRDARPGAAPTESEEEVLQSSGEHREKYGLRNVQDKLHLEIGPR